MEIRPITKPDFDHIVEVVDRWWGGASRMQPDPIFFYELGELARVVVDDGTIAGFVLAFLAPHPEPVGYIHLVGVHPDYRRRGVGKLVYAWFEDECKKRGARSVKAISAPGNEGSILFHRGIGWTVTEEADYAGPGRARIVFSKVL